MIMCEHIDKYDERNARQHIKRIKEILTTPPVLTAQTDPQFMGPAQGQDNVDEEAEAKGEAATQEEVKEPAKDAKTETETETAAAETTVVDST